MDARIPAFFLVLCLSTGYSLKSDDQNDDVLDQLLEKTDPLNEAAGQVVSPRGCCSICRSGLRLNPGRRRGKPIIVFNEGEGRRYRSISEYRRHLGPSHIASILCDNFDVKITRHFKLFYILVLLIDLWTNITILIIVN